MGRDIRIETGMYAMDRGLFAPIAEKRLSKQWPKQFLFIGQHTRRKGVDILIKAYTKYRQSVRDPWPLLTCGQGPLGKALESTEGIINKGFLQPAELPVVMLESGVFILPSRYEPWGVVLTEACVSGLPVIATSECGSGEAVLRDGENGLMVRPGDSNALCACMIRMHEDYLRLPAMGRKSVSLAERYSAEAWAKKIREGVNKLLR
jgi:glycosyltransferase involved in cell wall biosynthesis